MGETIRILLVDDEKNVLRSLERTFLDEDYEVLTASSGDEGLSVLREVFPIHVVISDYRMPDMNGVEFLREVCRQWPDTARIVLSGYADTASIVSAINDGQIYKFIPKPWNDDELKIAILNAVERYHLNKRNKELGEELRIKNKELERINESLERLVAEKSSKVRLLNEILAKVQNINYAIPVGVIGMDPDGVIVQCNREAEKMLRGNNPDFLGKRCEERLPADVCEFVRTVFGNEAIYRMFTINGAQVKVTASIMEDGDQNGKIVVFIRED